MALGLAASRVLQCTEQGVGQRAGGRDRVTGQGASCRSQHGWPRGSVAAAASSFTAHNSSSLTSSSSAVPVRPPLIPVRGTASPRAEGM